MGKQYPNALGRCPRLVRLFQRCLLSLMTKDVLPTLCEHVGLSGAAEDGVESGRKICEDMLFWRQQQQLRFPQNTSFPFGDVRRWLLLFEGRLELQEPLGQLCTTLKEAWLKALQDTPHHVRPT